jgi:hypothetical protein
MTNGLCTGGVFLFSGGAGFRHAEGKSLGLIGRHLPHFFPAADQFALTGLKHRDNIAATVTFVYFALLGHGSPPSLKAILEGYE